IDLGVMVPAQTILDTARKEGADVIGLSGLITPSLDEMVRVGKEMTRQGFTLPLLIGGATTSRAHTAVKIAPGYTGPTIHVLDASRGVGVVSQLLSAERRDAYLGEIGAEYERLRTEYGTRDAERVSLALAEARRRRLQLDWTPFFQAWELKGSYPAIFQDGAVGEAAKKVFADAQVLLQRFVAERLVRARAVFGLFPANTIGDD